MLARVTTFTIDGIEPRRVWVEVDLRPGLPAFTIVGLGDAAVRESRDRVRAAILNSGFRFPSVRLTANLAPAYLRKVGPGFDSALALGILAASGQLPAHALGSLAVYGELSLGGELRDTPGALAVAEGARRLGLGRLIVPASRVAEAALVDGLRVAGARTLGEAVALVAADEVRWQTADRHARRPDVPAAVAAGGPAPAPDLADLRGQGGPVLALEIAAAGGHNLLLEGPPGTGKTMLARRMPSILPPLTRAEAITVTRIHSVAGIHPGGLIDCRPFRAPHHSISAAGLVGGGSPPRPGEAVLANHGVLFLDELAEFSRSVLDALRQPIEDGQVTIVRGQRALSFPTRFVLLAAANPCPCGWAGVGDRCRCGEADLQRHARRLSGPLLDRMDLLVTVGRPTSAELAAPPVARSADVRARVLAARERQAARAEGEPGAAACNGELGARATERLVRLDGAAAHAVRRAYERGGLSARGRHRVLRVARTVGDLAGHERVTVEDVLAALALRRRDPAATEDVAA